MSWGRREARHLTRALNKRLKSSIWEKRFQSLGISNTARPWTEFSPFAATSSACYENYSKIYEQRNDFKSNLHFPPRKKDFKTFFYSNFVFKKIKNWQNSLRKLDFPWNSPENFPRNINFTPKYSRFGKLVQKDSDKDGSFASELYNSSRKHKFTEQGELGGRKIYFCLKIRALDAIKVQKS